MARLLAESTSNVGGFGDECKLAAYGQCCRSGSICLYASANVSAHLAPGIDINDLHVIGQVNINTQKKLMIQKKLFTLNLKKTPLWRKKLATLNLKKTPLCRKKNFTITQLQPCLWTDIPKEMEHLS